MELGQQDSFLRERGWGVGVAGGGEVVGAGRGDIWMDAGEDGTPDFLVM